MKNLKIIFLLPQAKPQVLNVIWVFKVETKRKPK